MNKPEVFVSERKRAIAATVAVAATYVYFLLFAEFAFLALVQPVAGAALRGVMGALGAGGIAGSVLAALALRPGRERRLLAGAFGLCVLAAGAALGVGAGAGLAGAFAVAAAVGLGAGALTVTLASVLRAVAGEERLGLVAGVGTGAAYALCNLPGVFDASPAVQTALSAGAALIGAAAVRWMIPAPPEERKQAAASAWRTATWILVFLALVWLDSAAFYIIQHAPVLKRGMWGGHQALLANGGMHFAVALLAGFALARRRIGAVAVLAVALLGAACLLLQDGTRAGVELLYVAGVSLYSAALVYYPARSGRPWVAAAIFGVAGWLGSALGIGMAQDLHEVPVWFVAAAIVLVLGAVGVRAWRMTAPHRRVGFDLPLAGLAMVAGLAWPDRAQAEGDDALVRRGREVFIGEGCIHCHSQFVRPGTIDVERWGPARPLADLLKEEPPLPGNRRQGPDLANVGNRRSLEWNRLHLMEPRAVSPGSRMPAYAHLFRQGNPDGEALLAYLETLGADSLAERRRLIEVWIPAPAAGALISEAEGRRLFGQLCVPCHGAEGRGDGTVAAKLSLHPPDFAKGAWRRVDASQPEASLARIIKFGLMGTPMAGHESLRDEEVVALARTVIGLHGGDR